MVKLHQDAFNELLTQMDGQQSSNYHFLFNALLNEGQLDALVNYITRYPTRLNSVCLSFHVNQAMLENTHFQTLLETLKQTSLQKLELVFSTEELGSSVSEIAALLNENVVTRVNYPTLVCEQSNPIRQYNNEALNAFNEQVIDQVQRHNQAMLFGTGEQPSSSFDEQSMDVMAHLAAHSLDKKIKLKALIKHREHSEHIAPYIKLEVQHTEVEQQQETQEEIIDVAVQEQEQQQEYGLFDGRLVDYASFHNQPYRSLIISDTLFDAFNEELFGNMPKAIKFLSHEAAIKMAENAGALIALNADNLPQNFMLKITDKGEMVLDYDSDADEQKTNEFTPKEIRHYDAAELIYEHVKLPESVKKIAEKYALDTSSKQLDNLWVRYGDAGVELLFDGLGEPSDLSRFIIQKYLNRFPHWDRLLDDHQFLASLEKIKHYDPVELTCLIEFLLHTDDTTQFNLEDILKGFDAFWSEWSLLADQNKLNLNEINGKCSHKKIGNPVVYMERLLTILRNSRDLAEQLACLDVHSFDNYGAYYASKYEGFRVVSKEMGLNYEPIKQNDVIFNPDSSVYHADFELLKQLIEYFKVQEETHQAALRDSDASLCFKEFALKRGNCYIICSHAILDKTKLTKELLQKKINDQDIIPYDGRQLDERYKPYLAQISTDGRWQRMYVYEPIPGYEMLRDKLTYKEMIETVYRIIAQQSKGISIPDYAKAFKLSFEHEWGAQLERYPSQDIYKFILPPLLFVAHERYEPDSRRLGELFSKLSRYERDNNILLKTNYALIQLFQQGTYLNIQEGVTLFTLIDEYAVKWGRGSKEHYRAITTQYIDMFFVHLQNNKHGVLKALEYIADKALDQSSLPCLLDNALYFMAEPDVANFYKTDLFLFSAMIVNNNDLLRHRGLRIDISPEIVSDISNETIMDESHQRLRSFLLKAATEAHPNNLDYAFKALVQSRQDVDRDLCLLAFNDIDKLKGFNNNEVEAILKRHGFTLRSTPLPEVFSRDSSEVKNAIIQVLLALETSEGITIGFTPPTEKQPEQYRRWQNKFSELRPINIKDLQVRLNQAWATKGLWLSFCAKRAIMPILQQLKNYVIHDALTVLGSSSFVTELQDKIKDLPSFKDAYTFDEIDRVANEAASLSGQFKAIMRCNYFQANTDQLTQIFSRIDYTGYDYNTLFFVLDLLVNMPGRDYAEVLGAYIDVSNQYSTQEKIDLIDKIRVLHQYNLPSAYITKFISLIPEIHGVGASREFHEQIIVAFQRDEADPLLRWMMQTDGLTIPQLLDLSTLTQGIIDNRAAVHSFFKMMNDVSKPAFRQWLTNAKAYPHGDIQTIIEILAMSYSATPSALLKKEPVDYLQLTTMLAQLSQEDRDSLYAKLCKSGIAITCLHGGLSNRNPDQPFNDFLNDFEKAPFGARDFTAQFDIQHVERVVNGFTDLNNQSAYSYTYRKQMMEAFLFVNSAGSDLPIYLNKPAKDLLNDEITGFFSELKSGGFSHLDPFQRRLYALGLMREAMYRTTGQFPYSTQMITLIDCMMHQGDVISNIDTGQGKSMIDTMKATLLWLESGRVDLTTASLIDAKRDLDVYCLFWSFLGVPFAKTPISSTSDFGAYEQHGINVGTMAQFALFYSKAKVEQVDLESENASLVMNESDYTILDDRTVYRYASTGGPGLIGAGKEWVYDAINQFVMTPHFKAGITSEEQDIASLKEHLLKQAVVLKKSPKFIETFSNKKLLMLLESAIIVNYRLRENFDYVLTEKSEPRRVNGVLRQTRSAKIIMKDGKVSTDTQYGNGMQQLLYSKLNKIHGDDSFVIEPESKTIISLNNKNMIDYYRAKKGFIWGSSGTVGFGQEIDRQYQQYGFEFSKVEPHQRNIVLFNQPVISVDEKAQFKHIIELLQPGKTSPKYMAPTLVIFKDIETATRFHAHLKDLFTTQPMQLYTGFGHEEKAIHDAALSGMITIATPALGRNTDIHYDKSVGMNVILTFVASSRNDHQKEGRTGRQGSNGTVYYSLNQTDLGQKTIKDVRALLEEKAEIERQFNEELYDVLGYFLRLIGKADKAFFKEKWSEFSEQVESNYRAQKLSGDYNSDDFLTGMIVQFNELFGRLVSIDHLKQTLTQQQVKKENDLPDHQPVVLGDCISPDIIAYHFLSPTAAENVPEYLEDEVKAKLTALFDAVNTKHYTALNNDYIIYLNMGSASKAVIKKAHQTFLSEYLAAQVTQSQQSPFYKRWFGFEGHLNKVMGDSSYLLLFKAMMDVQDDKTTNIDIKTAVVTLLEEYTQYSWFISDSKRNAANTLIDQMKATNTIEEVIELLSTGIFDVMKQDRDINQNSFWRKIKPVNASGDSRLQNTLERALKLASVMSSKTISAELIDGIRNESQTTDATSAKLASKHLRSVLDHNRLYTSVDGMKGRPQPESDDDTSEPKL